MPLSEKRCDPEDADRYHDDEQHADDDASGTEQRSVFHDVILAEITDEAVVRKAETDVTVGLTNCFVDATMREMTCKLVGYLRVSTRKQGDSGLGIEGQQAAIQEYVQKTGCELVATYSEVETGKKHDLTNRPELRKAIAHARRSKATLVVAKLDRLLRSTVIANMLKTSGVKFVACDNPHLDEFSVDIHAAVAANEVRQISKRTKDALAALKARGVVLGAARPGAPQLSAEARQKGTTASVKAARANFIAAYSDLTEIVGEMRADGMSLRAIAARLNELGHTTRRGKQWGPMQVASVLTLVPCES